MAAIFTGVTSVTAVSAQSNFQLLRGFRAEGRIAKLIVKQLSGTLAGFRVDLYSTRGVAPVDGSSSEAGSTLDEDLYRVIPTLTAANLAATVEIFSDSGGYVYRNTDGNNSSPEQGLYMRIIPAGTGSKTFGISYTTIGVW